MTARARSIVCKSCIGGMLATALAAAALGLGGCASYAVPGQAADFRAMGITQEQADRSTDWSIARRLDRKPLARFPSSIAVVRIQGSGYRSYTVDGYGRGRYSVVTTRDIESDEAFRRLAAMPMVNGVAPLNRLVLPEKLETEENLREAASAVQADMLLIYTFDTVFGDQNKVKPLALLSLGLLPDREAKVTSTASAALVDTRNGYVYGLAESTGRDGRITNAWNTSSAADASRRKAEQEAFDGLIGQIETMWKGVVARMGPDGSETAKAPDGSG